MIHIAIFYEYGTTHLIVIEASRVCETKDS